MHSLQDRPFTACRHHAPSPAVALHPADLRFLDPKLYLVGRGCIVLESIIPLDGYLSSSHIEDDISFLRDKEPQAPPAGATTRPDPCGESFYVSLRLLL